MGIIEVTERGSVTIERKVLIPVSSIAIVVDQAELGALIRVAPNIRVEITESYDAVYLALTAATTEPNRGIQIARLYQKRV